MSRSLFGLVLLVGLTGCDSSAPSADEIGLTQADLDALSALYDCRVEGVSLGGGAEGDITADDCLGDTDLYAFRVGNDIRLDLVADSEEIGLAVRVRDYTRTMYQGVEYDGDGNGHVKASGFLPAGTYVVEIESTRNRDNPENRWGTYTLRVDKRSY